MATDETTVPYIPMKDARATVDCVSVAPTSSGERVELTLTLCVELETAVALDLAMRIIGAVARSEGLDAGGRP